jgi:hypothetical protein
MGDSERFSLIKARFQKAKRGSTKTGTVCYGFLKLLIKMKSSKKTSKSHYACLENHRIFKSLDRASCISVLWIPKYFLRILIRETNYLRVRPKPDPEPIWTFLCPLKKKYAVKKINRKPLNIIKNFSFFLKLSLNV